MDKLVHELRLPTWINTSFVKKKKDVSTFYFPQENQQMGDNGFFLTKNTIKADVLPSLKCCQV